MFERLFNRPVTLAQQWAGPLVEDRLRYLSHLAEQGVARHGLQVRAECHSVKPQLSAAVRFGARAFCATPPAACSSTWTSSADA